MACGRSTCNMVTVSYSKQKVAYMKASARMASDMAMAALIILTEAITMAL
jgi:hypothetical protein